MQHIDLDNFEQPQFQAAPYILTSPRSLRACAKHAIRPVDLLPRSVEDFERMYAPLGYSAQQVRAETILHEERRQGEIDFVVVFLSSLAKPAVAVALSVAQLSLSDKKDDDGDKVRSYDDSCLHGSSSLWP